jgi:DNA-binding winged helix-turn-helix (wHTH) protein
MPNDLVQFDDFVLNRSACELRRGDALVPLRRVPLELLSFLLERRGQLVTRKEILERVWGKGVFIDGETSINTAVRKLRRALSDDPHAPRFVATVPARGYRFVAEIRSPKPGLMARAAGPRPAPAVVASIPSRPVVCTGSAESNGPAPPARTHAADSARDAPSPSSPLLAAPQASDVFSEQVLERRVVQQRLRQQSLQAPVLILQPVCGELLIFAERDDEVQTC